MSPEEIIPKSNSLDCLDNYVLKQALLMTEVAMDLRERYIAAEKYVNYLKIMINGAEKAVAALQMTSKSSFSLAQKLLQSNMWKEKLPENLKLEYENLQAVINREMSAIDLKFMDDNQDCSDGLNLDQLADKIRALESRNRGSDNNFLQANTSSARSSKIDIDERYPENLSRESLIDLNTVINLPPVPEDIFSSFSNNNNKPVRTSSLSSLKSMRKIKLFLQKAESSDDDDSSDNDEHDYSRLVYGDSDDSKTSSCHSPLSKKLQLGNIKEETQD